MSYPMLPWLYKKATLSYAWPVVAHEMIFHGLFPYFQLDFRIITAFG